MRCLLLLWAPGRHWGWGRCSAKQRGGRRSRKSTFGANLKSASRCESAGCSRGWRRRSARQGEEGGAGESTLGKCERGATKACGARTKTTCPPPTPIPTAVSKHMCHSVLHFRHLFAFQLGALKYFNTIPLSGIKIFLSGLSFPNRNNNSFL